MLRIKSKSEIYFNKRINEITEVDLKNFIKKGIEEGVDLEYKAFSDEIWKDHFYGVLQDICAFANVEGGLLLFGISQNSKCRPKGFKGSPNDKISKFDVERKINTGISYQISGLKVESVDVVNNDGFNRIFIIEVPQSMNPPHQIRSGTNRRYYLRIDHESVEMDHCWVEALFQKRLKPEITVDLALGQNWAENDYKRYGRDVRKYEGEMRITNTGYISAYDVYFVLTLFNGVVLTTKDKNISLDNEMEPKSLFNEYYYFNIHPQMRSRGILFQFDAHTDGPFYFYITVSAKDIKPVIFFFKIDTESGEKLTNYCGYSIDQNILTEQTKEFTKTQGKMREIEILLNIIKGQEPNHMYDIKGFRIEKRY